MWRCRVLRRSGEGDLVQYVGTLEAEVVSATCDTPETASTVPGAEVRLWCMVMYRYTGETVARGIQRRCGACDFRGSPYSRVLLWW